MKERIAFLAAVFGLTMTMTVYAGDINENEQRIVSVIYGQFEQDGIIYEVRPEYINSALNYLSRDDNDLTSDQADYVISEIYANVQTGVESGYLREIGRVQPETAPQTEQAPQGGTAAQSPEGESQAETGEAGTEPEGETQAGETPSEPAGEAAAETEAPEAPKPIAIAALEAAGASPSQSYAYIRRDTDERMNSLYIPYETVFLAAAVCGAVVGICFLLALWLKFFSAHHRHKLRVFLRVLSGAANGVAVCILLLFLGLWIGAFQDSSVLNHISDTDYYRTIYDDLRYDTGVSFALMDIPDSVMDESITYERVVMAARQQLENDLHEGEYRANTSLLTDQLRSDVSAYLESRSIVMTDKARTGLEILIERLDTKYENLLQWPFGPWWSSLSGEFGRWAGRCVPLLIAILLAGVLNQYWLCHYPSHGVRNMGGILLAGSMIAVLAGIAFRIWGMSGWETVTPSYMGQFFGIYRSSICKAVVGTGVCGIVLSAAFYLCARTLKGANKDQHGHHK